VNTSIPSHRIHHPFNTTSKQASAALPQTTTHKLIFRAYKYLLLHLTRRYLNLSSTSQKAPSTSTTSDKMNETTANSNLPTSQPSTKPSDRPHTPSLVSPPGSRTPPAATTMQANAAEGSNRRSQSVSEAVDADALTRALRNFESAGRRDRTPGASPARKRQRVYGDR